MVNWTEKALLDAHTDDAEIAPSPDSTAIDTDRFPGMVSM
jgi:hypothetical protein